MKPKIFEQNCILFYDYWINSINYWKSMLYLTKSYKKSKPVVLIQFRYYTILKIHIILMRLLFRKSIFLWIEYNQDNSNRNHLVSTGFILLNHFIPLILLAQSRINCRIPPLPNNNIAQTAPVSPFLPLYLCPSCLVAPLCQLCPEESPEESPSVLEFGDLEVMG